MRLSLPIGAMIFVICGSAGDGDRFRQAPPAPFCQTCSVQTWPAFAATPYRLAATIARC